MRRVSEAEIPLLARFLESLGSGAASFRYYRSRPLEVIRKHLVTVLLVEGESPIAYGHLEPEGETLWLGIAVSEGARGRGLGRTMLRFLIDYAREQNLEKIDLTVDLDNAVAINLYRSVGFCEELRDDRVIRFSLVLR